MKRSNAICNSLDTAKKKKLSLNQVKIIFKISNRRSRINYHLPSEPTQNSGLDALNQAFESLWNKNYNFKTSIIAYRATKLSLKGLDIISENLNSKKARYNLQSKLVSWFMYQQNKDKYMSFNFLSFNRLF